MPNPTEDQSFTWSGIYRAKVIDSKDPSYQGRVKVWCPDIMPEIEDDQGIWARPANNPVGGRNNVEDDDQYFQGTCMIPALGSYVYIFFEYGNLTEPRYLSGGDFGQTKVPIENQQGSEYEKKWTLYKSRMGRTIIVSDDPHDERVEIIGKKRNLSSSDPSGNSDSVYAIDNNQTVILIDERSGHEKILIKDYKGNFINFNVKDQKLHIDFASDIEIKSGGNIKLECDGDMDVKVGGSLRVKADQNIDVNGVFGLNMGSEIGLVNMKGTAGTNIDSLATTNVRGTTGTNIDSLAVTNVKGSASVNVDGGGMANVTAAVINVSGGLTNIQSGAGSAIPAAPAITPRNAVPASPIGNRNDPSTFQGPSDNPPDESATVPITPVFTEKPPEL